MERGINFCFNEGLYYTHYDFGIHGVYPRGSPPPPRYPVQNGTTYPHCAVGRLIVPQFGKYTLCTATLVGKRHILTASQCAAWANYEDDSQPGSAMLFEPGYYWGERYPPSYVVYSFWVQKVSPDSWERGDNGGDWLVGVLDRQMEITNGKFGLQSYEEQWNGQDLWNMLGYPIIVSNGNEQVFHGPMAVIDTEEAQYGTKFALEGVTYVGEVGAPIYGMFDGFPRIIGINSGNDVPGSFSIIAHGGDAMVRLINKAIEEAP
jgi:V8-like Glu-specific endopeptidase